MTLAEKIQHAAKAVTGAVTAGAAAATTALQDGQITGTEWVTIAVAVAVGAGLVYAVPNKAPDAPVDFEQENLG